MSDVVVKLSSPDIDASIFNPCGITLQYGVNTIPTASIELNPVSKHGKVFLAQCDFDSLRRKRLSITISTPSECMYFNGVIDGLSFNQSPGGMVAHLVVKHPAIWLTEVYPRIVGLHPTAIDFFNQPSPITIKDDSSTNSDPSAVGGQQLLMSLAVSGNKFDIDTNLNAIDYMVQLIKLGIQAQQNVLPVLTKQQQAGNLSDALSLILADMNLPNNLLIPTALNLLNTIDTAAIQALEIGPADQFFMDSAVNMISNMSNSVFDNIVRVCKELGCCVIVGNEKIFIVPEAGYLKVNHPNNPGFQQKSHIPNISFPADYNSFQFNDNGFVNLRGVYVTQDSGASASPISHANLVDLGKFIDKSAVGNIMVTSLPYFISKSYLSSAKYNGQGVNGLIQDQTSVYPSKLEIADTVTSYNAMVANDLAVNNACSTFMDQWAEMYYCKAKYDDRTGSINSWFTSKWVPGAMGACYTRYPGLWCDFFVQGVTHHIALSAPASGTATTSVNFKCGRMGATLGIDQLSLYSYSYTESSQFCNSFITDLTT